MVTRFGYDIVEKVLALAHKLKSYASEISLQDIGSAEINPLLALDVQVFLRSIPKFNSKRE